MIEAAIRTLLTGDATIAASVGTRVRPLIAWQGDAMPHLVYSVDTQTIPTHSGPADFKRAAVTVSVCAGTYKACADLSAEVRRVLDGRAGTTGSVDIRPSLLDDESEIEQGVEPGTERPVFVRTQTYRVLYRATS